MTNEESNEAKLLRVLIGYFHISLMNQLALSEHSKPLRSLDQSDKDSIENQMIAAVANIAKQVTPETLKAILAPTPHGPPPVFH